MIHLRIFSQGNEERREADFPQSAAEVWEDAQLYINRLKDPEKASVLKKLTPN